ncbi:MAG: meso-butanediol dehydrogenase / (S,S)-butanediol dehydrogenase / diacetyl reductase [Microbacteriaceae bacterium]|jgi:NAD(P)-dependent dehydrogenase (short-subunit alcohol dehydrogenase family)|nr:meso-butanediol dehydrogenase / (S,S)-butanediol dehydrogenase / diacetyl reductase [Microbacteriaceae bacterium]
MGKLSGRVCLVTGAAKGIGRAVAARLAEEGASVALADVDGAAVLRTADELRSAGADVTAYRVDVSRSRDVADWVAAAAEHFGRIDALVNNAGVAVSGGVESLSEADWDRVVSVNLKGVWLGMKYAIPVMRATGGGSIVNMSSVQALVGFPGWAGYAATKGAIIALTQQAAVEYGPENIRVNCLAPGTIMTPMNEAIFRNAPDPEALIADWNSSHALGRFGRPTEVAAAAAFLVSDDSSFVTGACLRVDGGLTVLGPTGRAD